MSVFPGSIPPVGAASPTDSLAVAGHTALHNSHSNEIRELATKVGTGSSTATTGTVLRGTGAGTSSWAQVALTTDVTGVLPVANGGTGQSTLTAVPLASPAITGTVSGGATYTSPTLTTPTIASFANATHDHTNSAGGGQLGTGAIQDSAITAAKIANRTRSIGMQLSADSPAGTANAATVYNHAGQIVRFTSSAGSFGRAFARVPLDYSGGDVTVRLLWASDTIQTRDLNYYQNAMDTSTASIWSISNQTASSGLVIAAANTLYETTLTYADATVSAGTHVAFAIRPLSGTGTIDLYAATLEYTADS